jgi:hypothetical protein
VLIYQNGNSDARLSAAKKRLLPRLGRRLELKRLTASRLVAANLYQNPYSPDWPNTDNPESAFKSALISSAFRTRPAVKNEIQSRPFGSSRSYRC